MKKQFLKGRWALVTGATAGIGEATSRALAAEGVSLILTGRRQERLASLAKELKKDHGVECEYFSFDISKHDQVEHFLKTASGVLEKLDILVNNAGLASGADPLPQGKAEDWDRMIDTNIKGLLWMTRGVVPYLIKKKKGDVVNLGSVAGRWVYPSGAVYCSTKFAVRALSEGLRMDLFGTGVRVTNVEPGMVETEFSVVRLGDDEKAKKVYQGMTPLAAQDIADTIVWCLARPSHVNIQEVVIFPTDQYAIQMVDRR